MKIPCWTRLEIPASLRLFSALFLASIGIFIGGTSVGWTSAAARLQRHPGGKLEEPVTSEALAWLVSLLELGTVISPYPASYLMDRWGRRNLIITSAPLAMIGSTLLYFANSVTLLLIARFIQGLYTGIVYLVLPLYACEAAPARFRGTACTIFATMYSVGIMFSYIAGNSMCLDTLNLWCTFAPVIYLGVVFCIPETPYFFLMKNNESEARSACIRFDKHFDEASFQHMRVCVENEMKLSVFKDVLTNAAHPFFTVLILRISLRFTYFWNTPTHAVYILRFADSDFSTDQYIIAVAFILFLAAMVTFCSVKLIGRRKSAMIAVFLTVTFAFPTSLLFYLQHEKKFDICGSEWYITLLVSFLVFCANLGLAPMPIVQQTEFFPTKCRAFAGALLISVSSVAGWIAGAMYRTIVDSLGLHCVYFVSGSIAVLIFLVLWLTLPEVKGISLHDIQLNVKYPTPKRRFNPSDIVPKKNVNSLEQTFWRGDGFIASISEIFKEP